jgi:hypothetical protein
MQTTSIAISMKSGGSGPGLVSMDLVHLIELLWTFVFENSLSLLQLVPMAVMLQIDMTEFS